MWVKSNTPMQWRIVGGRSHYIEDPKIAQEWYGKPFTIFQIKAKQPRDPTNQVNKRYYDLSKKMC